jgi:hypothetical protein
MTGRPRLSVRDTITSDKQIDYSVIDHECPLDQPKVVCVVWSILILEGNRGKVNHAWKVCVCVCVCVCVQPCAPLWSLMHLIFTGHSVAIASAIAKISHNLCADLWDSLALSWKVMTPTLSISGLSFPNAETSTCAKKKKKISCTEISLWRHAINVISAKAWK